MYNPPTTTLTLIVVVVVKYIFYSFNLNFTELELVPTKLILRISEIILDIRRICTKLELLGTQL